MEKKIKRQIRVRSKIKGTRQRPRLSVFRSNRFIYAQLIDDDKGQTIIELSEKELDNKTLKTKTERAKALGIILAKQAKTKKINTVVFDRGSYAYHGRVQALAEGAREGGLKF